MTTDNRENLTDWSAQYGRNLSFLPAALARRLEALSWEEVCNSVQIRRGKGGLPVCLLRNGEKTVAVNRRDPLQQARRWAEQFPLANMGTVFLFGSGFGYVVAELAAGMQPGTRILVFERDIRLFAAMLNFVDLPAIQGMTQMEFFIGQFEEFLPELWDFTSTSALCFLTAPAVLFAPDARLAKEEYLLMQRQVFGSIARQVFKLGNDLGDTFLGFHNMVENAPVALKSPRLSALCNQFSGVPVFLVANGPSLDRNIRQLKRIGGKGIVLCCESAIAALMKNGVHPDAIVVSERTPASYLFHFSAMEYPKDMALLALAVADPRTFRSFPGPKVPVFRSLESNSRWISGLLGAGEGVSGGINVSHLAFELAVYMGGNPVVLVGQDLAYGAEGLTHSKDSRYAEAGRDYIESIKGSPVVYVEAGGEAGGKIASTPDWVAYREWLEQLIAQNPRVRVINATEGGARIQGTESRPLAEVIEEYCVTPLPRGLVERLRQESRRWEVPTESHLKESKEQGGGKSKGREEGEESFREGGRRRLEGLAAELGEYVEIYRALQKSAEDTCAWIAEILEQENFAF